MRLNKQQLAAVAAASLSFVIADTVSALAERDLDAVLEEIGGEPEEYQAGSLRTEILRQFEEASTDMPTPIRDMVSQRLEGLPE